MKILFILLMVAGCATDRTGVNEHFAFMYASGVKDYCKKTDDREYNGDRAKLGMSFCEKMYWINYCTSGAGTPDPKKCKLIKEVFGIE